MTPDPVKPRAMILAMRRPKRALLIALTLALWLVSGPVGMAFDGCAMMGTMCEAPCGISSYIVAPISPGLVAIPSATSLPEGAARQLALTPANPLDPPPKSPLRSA
jgi:hypothetical protein